MEDKYKIRDCLKTIIEEEQIDVETLSKETNVSKRTLFGILKNTKISDDTLEKIFSYAYEQGYRFNQIKSELYIEQNKAGTVFFHGSKYGLGFVSCSGFRNDCDFGPGFYTSENYSQAASFVCEYSDSDVTVVVLNEDNLKIKEFTYDLDWMIAICYYRGTIKQYENHPLVQKIIKDIEDSDIVIAPIADNRMHYIMQEFADGEITTKQAIYSLAASGLGKQVVFRSEEAIEGIKLVDTLYLSKPEKKDFIKTLEERTMFVDTKIKMSKREFKGEGQYIDELFQ